MTADLDLDAPNYDDWDHRDLVELVAAIKNDMAKLTARAEAAEARCIELEAALAQQGHIK